MEFPSTMWSEIAVATMHGDTRAAQALERFCQKYREPVRQFIRCRGFAEAEAEDLTHEFFLHLMKHSTLKRADRARGRFRSFLLGALARFLHDERDRRNALKRGAGENPDTLGDNLEDKSLVTETDVTQFDQAWALALVESAYRKLEREFAETGREETFLILKSFLPGTAAVVPYEEAAGRLGYSDSRIKTEIHRLRARFREHMRAEVLETVSRPHEVDEELAYLGRVLRVA